MIESTTLITAFLVFMRVIGFVYSAPLLGSKFIPKRVKLYMCLVISFVTFVVLDPVVYDVKIGSEFYFFAFSNLVIGLFTGILITIAFAFTQFGGHIIALSSGLGFSTLADPVNGNQTTTVSNFYGILGYFVFIMMGGFMSLILILQNSFEMFSIFPSGIGVVSVEYVLQFSEFFLENSLLLAAPMLFTALLMNLSFGIISKASPSLNVFAVGFPVGIWITFLFVALTFHAFPLFIGRLIEQLPLMISGVNVGR
jgi:flagellar biosynthetic protein FliR